MSFFKGILGRKAKQKKSEKYRLGMEKTRSSVFGNLNTILTSGNIIDDSLFDELEEVFIMADIGVNTVVKFVSHLREVVELNNIINASELKDIIVEEMFKLYVGDEVVSSNLNLNDKINVVLFIGVNGVGKTTTIGKIANEYLGKDLKVLMVAGDTFRAGAIEQLKIWAQRVGADFFSKEEGSDPSSVIFDAIDYAKNNDIDLVLIDTAGRLQNKLNLMKELEKINKVIKREIPNAPQETLLVVDATTGQNGLNQAKIFNEVTDISGIVLTKLDGTAKGGIALGIKDELNIPIKYVGLGEKLEDLEHFDIEDYIYGMFVDLF